ncbi:MAG: ArnT family glycosyltransferase, partial [Chloroflexia bacterium]
GVLRWGRQGMVRLGGVGLSVGLAVAASLQYLGHPGETFGVAGWLWVGSMAVLLGATIGWPRAVGAESEGEKGLEDEAPRWEAWEVAAFAGVVGLAVVLRVWDLAGYPFAIHGDEVLTGGIALQAYSGTAGPSVFGTLWTDINLPALWFVVVAGSLKLGGVTLAMVRLPAALFGAATVVPFYGLVRGVWGRTAALAGSAVLAFSASNLQYSRVTLNNIVTPFFWATCFFFLMRGVRSGRPSDWALAGLAAGLSEYTYYGTRLLPFVLVVFCAYLLAVHWRAAGRYLGRMGLMAVGYFVGFGPLLAYFTQHPGLYFGRGAGVLIWDHIPTSWEDAQRMWATLWPVISQNLLTFSTTNADDSLWFAPLLLPVEGALLALGAGLLMWRWRHPAAFLVLLSGLGVLFVGGTLVPKGAFPAHWTPAFPAIYAAVAVAFGEWAAHWGRLPERLRRAGPALLVGVLALLCAANLDFYFGRYYAVRPEFEIAAAQSRFEAALGAGYRVRVVGQTWQPYNPEMTGLLVKGQDGATLTVPEQRLPLVGESGKGLAFIFFEDNEQYREWVKGLYAGGETREVRSRDGRTHYFNAYLLTPAQAMAAYGVRLTLSNPGSPEVYLDQQVPRVGDLPQQVTYPVTARWSGSVYLPDAQQYRAQVTGAPGTVTFNGVVGGPDPQSLLMPGWYPLTVEATLEGPRDVKLVMGEGSATTEEVPSTRLWPREVTR